MLRSVSSSQARAETPGLHLRIGARYRHQLIQLPGFTRTQCHQHLLKPTHLAYILLMISEQRPAPCRGHHADGSAIRRPP